jgi:hypothetical protein
VFFCFASRPAGGIFAFGHAPAQAVNLFSQRSRRIDGLGRRDKRPRLELGVLAVGAVEPDAKLASEFQRRQRIGMIALGFVCRPVTRFAKRMENVSGFLRDDAFVGEAAKRLLKGFAFVAIERVMGSNRLAQKLGKLAQLENRGAGIVAKVSLGQSPKLHQLGIVHAKKCEIARWQQKLPHRGYPSELRSILVLLAKPISFD